MVSNIQHLVWLSILLSLFSPWGRAEWFSATAGTETLLETHENIKEDLEDYVTKEEKRLTVLKNKLEQYKVEHEKSMEDIPNYLGNPLNAFNLIKSLTIDLDEIYDNIKSGTEYIQNASMNYKDIKLPTLEDLAGAARALTRLQATYQLDVRDLAEGRIHGVAYSHPMSAADCFELCTTLYIMNDYYYLLAWSMETLRKYKEETDKKHSFTEVKLLEYIAYAHYKMNDIKNALEWSKKLLQLDTKHPRAARNVARFEKLIAEQPRRKIKRFLIYADDVDATEESKRYNPQERSDYDALCRGDIKINRGVAKRLFCRYVSETHPFLQLAPIKVEQVYIDPDVFVFHGVLSDDEIKAIKVLSTPLMETAKFNNPLTGKFERKRFRVRKLTWCRDEQSPVVARVSQRVDDMTGLSIEKAEELQVVNYGIGGYYEPQFDFTTENEDDESFSVGENRIATVLFYMSDVALGGATVFTELGLAVFPARGAALYWRNLHPSGEGDTATRHAACPVLRGSKWVCYKWLRQIGQELIQPCNLESQHEEMNREIPPARKKSSHLRTSRPTKRLKSMKNMRWN